MLGTPLHPASEMLRSDFVPVHGLSLEIAVNLMETQPVLSWYQGSGFQDVGTQFLDIACSAGIVSGDLDSSGQCAFAQSFESGHVICLPAMEGKRDFPE